MMAPTQQDATTVDLPVIDYSLLSFTHPTASKAECAAERARLYPVLRDIGFAYLKYPGITQAGVNQLFENSKTFFAKPDDVKQSILGRLDKGRGPSQGYSCPARLAANPRTSDNKEFFGVYRDDDPEKPNQWLTDDASITMRTDLVRFFASCHEVVRELLSALCEAVDIPPATMHAHVADQQHFIANLHYYPTTTGDFQNRVRAAAHTDYGCLTLLFNDSRGGLQVMNRQGNYMYVDRKEDCAIVNVGDLLSRFFNGLLPSTMHRVIEPPTSTSSPTSPSSTETEDSIPGRYSIAFFGHFNAHTTVQPLSKLVSTETPALFEPVNAAEHVKARVRQLHVAGHSLTNGEKKNEKEKVDVVKVRVESVEAVAA